MHLLYPIKAILMYFAILFAPADATKITLEGLDGSERIELVRDGGTWKAGEIPVSVDGETLVASGPEGTQPLKIRDFAALPGDHDWKQAPSFTLGEGTTLEKTGSGFILRRNSGSGEMNGVYRIVYGRPVPASVAQREITVNVFGAVKTPGAYRIPAGGSILDALAAAGGWNKEANLKKVSVIRGAAGEIPKVTFHDVIAILQGGGIAPALGQRDSINVLEAMF